MRGLSVLIFSYNDVERLLKAMLSVYDSADEVVVIDASTDKKKRLSKAQERMFRKLRIFRTPAFGDPDIPFMYGLNKCRYEWVLLLYSQEEVGLKLKEDIRHIVKTARHDALAIDRKELDENGGLLFMQRSWVRLFKRSKTSKPGYGSMDIHVDGTVGSLSGTDYYINHFSDYGNLIRGSMNYKNLQNYMKIVRVEQRVTYRSLLDKTGSQFVRLALRWYFRLKGVDVNSELTGSDYKLFFRVYWASQIIGLLFSEPTNLNMLRMGITYEKIKIKAFTGTPEGERKLELAIQKDMFKNGGPVKYLNLGDDTGMKAAMERSKKLKLSGADLYMALLKERYYTQRHFK